MSLKPITHILTYLHLRIIMLSIFIQSNAFNMQIWFTTCDECISKMPFLYAYNIDLYVMLNEIDIQSLQFHFVLPTLQVPLSD